MPKVVGTRRQKAEVLIERLEQGPSWCPLDFDKETISKIEEAYVLWSSTWIIEQTKELIPELRESKKHG